MLLKLWPIIRLQLDQFLQECSIFVVLIGCIRSSCNRGAAVFSYVAHCNFPCFQEGHIPLVFHLKYFLFVNIIRSYISWMILSVVCTFNLLQAIFLRVLQVLFTTFGTCLSSSSLWCPCLAFEGTRVHWGILLDSLKTIVDLHLLGSMGLIKFQDVSGSLGLYFAFSNGDSYIYNSLFSQGWCYLLFCCHCQLPTPHNSFGSVELLMQIGSAFRRMKNFYF